MTQKVIMITANSNLKNMMEAMFQKISFMAFV